MKYSKLYYICTLVSLMIAGFHILADEWILSLSWGGMMIVARILASHMEEREKINEEIKKWEKEPIEDNKWTEFYND